MDNQLVQYKNGAFTKVGNKEFSPFSKEKSTEMAIQIPQPPKLASEYKEDGPTIGTFATAHAVIENYAKQKQDIADNKWLDSFIERNVDYFNMDLQELNDSIQMLAELERLPDDFDVIGTQIDYLILQAQKRIRSEAQSIIKFYSIHGFESKEQARQLIEKTDFKNTDWVAFGIELFKQVHTQENSAIKKAKEKVATYYFDPRVETAKATIAKMSEINPEPESDKLKSPKVAQITMRHNPTQHDE